MIARTWDANRAVKVKPTYPWKCRLLGSKSVNCGAEKESDTDSDKELAEGG